MSNTAAQVPFAVKLEHSAWPTPATYVKVAELVHTGFPKLKLGRAKATNYDTSATAKTHEYVPGWKDGDSFECKANYVGAAHAAIDALQGTKLTWKLTFDDGATAVFPGHIAELDVAIPDAGTDEVYMSVFQMSVDGAVVFTPGP